eukprot:4880444-Pleurochrysis_carterae.AAC.1
MPSRSGSSQPPSFGGSTPGVSSMNTAGVPHETCVHRQPTAGQMTLSSASDFATLGRTRLEST